MAKRWLLAAFITFSGCDNATGRAAALRIADPLYSADLKGGWTELPSADSEQRTVRSEAQDVTVVMSAVPLNIPPDKTELYAHKMIEFRLSGEGRAAQEYGLQMTIAEPIVVARPWGHAIAYYGSDSEGRQFTYSGIITRKGVISIYADSKTKGEKELQATMEDVLEALEFDRTPIDPPQ